MRAIKNIPANFLLVTKKVLNELFGQLIDFEVSEYGLRDQCNCRLLRVQFKVNKKYDESLKKYLEHYQIENVEINQENDLITTKFEIRYEKIAWDFRQLFTSCLPNPMEYLDFKNYHNGEIKVMLFKRFKTKQIEFEIVNGNICNFSKDQIDKIEKALYIKRRSSIWEVLGTGCSCSSFEPLNCNELNKSNLLKLFIALQSCVNEEGEYQGVIRGKYDA